MEVIDINCETGKQIIREANEAELFAHNDVKKETEEIVKRMKMLENEKAALFEKLGITADEAKLLLS